MLHYKFDAFSFKNSASVDVKSLFEVLKVDKNSFFSGPACQKRKSGSHLRVEGRNDVTCVVFN